MGKNVLSRDGLFSFYKTIQNKNKSFVGFYIIYNYISIYILMQKNLPLSKLKQVTRIISKNSCHESIIDWVGEAFD
jgi:hypothetical protein